MGGIACNCKASSMRRNQFVTHEVRGRSPLGPAPGRGPPGGAPLGARAALARAPVLWCTAQHRARPAAPRGPPGGPRAPFVTTSCFLTGLSFFALPSKHKQNQGFGELCRPIRGAFLGSWETVSRNDARCNGVPSATRYKYVQCFILLQMLAFCCKC